VGFERSFVRSIRYISVQDPAIDWDHDAPADETDDQRALRYESAMAAYRDDPSPERLPLRPGATPAVFEFAPLSMSHRSRLMQMALLDEPRLIEQSIEAVACSLRSVTACTVDGSPITVELGKDGRVRQSTLEQLYRLLGDAVFVELGARILGDARLGPTSR
jgi:hypothetical protein